MSRDLVYASPCDDTTADAGTMVRRADTRTTAAIISDASVIRHAEVMNVLLAVSESLKAF